MAIKLSRLLGQKQERDEPPSPQALAEATKFRVPEGFTPTEIVIDGRVIGRTVFTPGVGIQIQSFQTPEEQAAVKLAQEREEAILKRITQEPSELIAERAARTQQFYQTQLGLLQPQIDKQRAQLIASQFARGISGSDIGRQEMQEFERQWEEQLAVEATRAQEMGEQFRQTGFQESLQQLGAVRGVSAAPTETALATGAATTASSQAQQQYNLALQQLAAQEQERQAKREEAKAQQTATAVLAGTVLGVPILQDIFRRRTGQTFGGAFAPSRPSTMQSLASARPTVSPTQYQPRFSF